jgi:hypothetical protein
MIVLYCIVFIHIKVEDQILQDIESVIFHYKMFHLQRNKSVDTVCNIPIYVQINVGSIDTNT